MSDERVSREQFADIASDTLDRVQDKDCATCWFQASLKDVEDANNG